MFRSFRLHYVRLRSAGILSHFHTCRVLEVPRKTLKEFKLADIGEGITECEVIRWNVKPPSPIQAFDPLCEVQSDKASVEITSPFEGIVKEILVREGEVAKVGAGLCTIEVEEDDIGGHADTSQPPTPTSPVTEMTQTSATLELPTERPRPPGRNLHPLDPRAATNTGLSLGQAGNMFATPSVRHYARQNGVDLAVLTPGSGKGGRIEKQDVEKYLARSTGDGTISPVLQEVHASEGEMVVELGRTRYSMWKAMTKSLEIPQFGFSTTIDLTELHHMLPLLNSHIPVHYRPSDSASSARSSAVISPTALLPSSATVSVPESARYSRLTYLPFLLKTLSKAMHEWPLFRSSLTPNMSSSEKPTLTVRPQADICIALSTPTGLYMPTFQAVDKATVYDVASRLKQLAHLGRQIPCALTPVEMPKHGGTITVSNVGAVGDVESASPVLVPGGGVAIMAVGRAKWVWDIDHFEGGAKRLKAGISWSADHRVVEGAELVAFVETWRSWIETPVKLIGYAI
ncbi:CoA-dependent acyltransferase [Daedalea quercina L-15889]|uniref:Dihydrolipoamide acetyltransferase component of pyruvate dehydrogenase complex n=1 Tax=Daedalea quercina L-15889 TaxID=1314783 RepID=A0A165PZT8_9APHY|nr:CoA-dependent acyltransferase [Daedalea quercina L-15889]